MMDNLMTDRTTQELAALLYRINTELASVKAEIAYQKLITRRLLTGTGVGLQVSGVEKNEALKAWYS